MPEFLQRPAAIVVLGNHSLTLARQIQECYPQASVYGLRGRVEDCDLFYDHFGETLRRLYQEGRPLIALCAAGIIIRTLAPLLTEKGAEPPVLAVAEDGSAVVPLLGGLSGVNHLARELGAWLGTTPAITTSGELRFGTCVLNPPPGYVLSDVQQGKRLVSDLLGGEAVCIEGQAPWLAEAQLPLDEQAQRRICISPAGFEADPHRLLIHPQVLLAYFPQWPEQPQAVLASALARTGMASAALNALLLPPELMGHRAAQVFAAGLGVSLRFIRAEEVESLPKLLDRQVDLSLHQAATPEQANAYGRLRGCLTVVGLGPGAPELMVPAVRQALDQAQDILGYETYVRMAGPFRADQQIHPSDNREELQRAAQAFALAAQGRRVVMVSSGDPGVFAMAAAVLEALEASDNPDWARLELQILPGVSAALATAAKAGAPLGHDFCVLSLSDNLKPWPVIEQRLGHAAAADLVMAFYNPLSKARPWQLGRALELIRQYRAPETLVVLGRDIGRPAERLRVLSLGELTPELVDMRTLVIIGSSTTRRFSRYPEGDWVYTPRWYPEPPALT